MTVRSFESTIGCARPLSNHCIRASYRLALAVGAILFAVAAITQPSLATPINYGSFMGTSVMYTGVMEEALSSDDTAPLFGPPTTIGPVTPGFPAVPCVMCGIPGNTLDFDPIGFEASSSGGGVPDITDGQLKFGIMVKPADPTFGITSVTLSEAGDTTLAGFGTNATFTSVTASGILNIHEVDGAAINTLSVPFSMTFVPQGGFYGLGNNGGGPFFHTQWAGGVVLDISDILFDADQFFLKGATKVSINLDNTLVAASQDGTTSLIAKKDFGGLSITVNQPGGPFIPEPSTVVLAGLALLGIGMVAGRRGGHKA